ncbi:hypothetical protein RFI_01237 [Reticulomyxa filosa]|uniref:Uncharacterized protein n=1 Tax=Reticulomyxa filosa TaxID=46433 RepID=X6PDT4_RETFI|nr:hypothetical protein RFI_01237 [Reticulomyxa filosa]|eukprot:ETO35827.1 hypothetical protein RFI_01237 [Reticulomyxa filosa]
MASTLSMMTGMKVIRSMANEEPLQRQNEGSVDNDKKEEKEEEKGRMNDDKSDPNDSSLSSTNAKDANTNKEASLLPEECYKDLTTVTSIVGQPCGDGCPEIHFNSVAPSTTTTTTTTTTKDSTEGDWSDVLDQMSGFKDAVTSEYMFQPNNPYVHEGESDTFEEAKEHFERGCKLMKEGCLNDAILVFEACVKTQPNHSQAGDIWVNAILTMTMKHLPLLLI